MVNTTVTEDLGSEIMVLFGIDAPPVEHASLAEAAAEEEDAAIPLTGGTAMWTARVAARSHIRPGSAVELAMSTDNLQFFDIGTGLSIGHPEAVGREE
jgi:multiple sugar transport system ATP-binding protein